VLGPPGAAGAPARYPASQGARRTAVAVHRNHPVHSVRWRGFLAGGALLGWVAGDTAVSDPAIKAWVGRQSIELTGLAPLVGAAYVLIHAWLARRLKTLKKIR